MADLSKLSTADLLALKGGDLSKVSTEGLLALKGPQEVGVAEDVGRGAASGVARGIPYAIDVPAAAAEAGVEYLGGKSFTDEFGKNMQHGLNAGASKVLGPEYQPQTYPGRMAKMGAMAAVTAPVGMEGALAPTMARAATAGALSVPGSDVGGAIGEEVAGAPGKVGGQILGGAAAGFGIPAGASGAATKVGAAVVPQVEDAVGTLAKRANALGIPLSVNQVAPSNVRNTVQKVSQEVPFSGVKGFEDTQRAAWNKAVAGTLGETADNLGPETIKSFLNRTSKGFNGVLDGQTLQVAPNDIKTLNNIVGNAKEAITGDLVGVVQKNVDKFKADVAKGAIPGEKLSSLRSAIVQNASRASAGAKEYLNDIVEHIDDIAERNLGPEAQEKLTALRRQWRNYKTIEPLLEKAPDGQINPTMLQQRVAASPYIKASRLAVGEDDLVDLARIGKQFLPKLGGSDTTQKAFLTGGLLTGGGTALYSPSSAIGGAALTGAAAAANRGYQKLYNQNSGIVKRMVKNAPDPKAKP